MKSIVFHRFGNPADVLQIREVPVPDPGPGQVRVRMIASPVNPSDVLMVRGLYGWLPKLPASPGFEGVGVVEAAGPGWLPRLRRGRRVVVLNSQGGNWQERVVVPARQVIPVPRTIPDEQAAMFFVNPASALVMVRSILRVPRGGWLLQTAAGSALGRMVIRLSRHYGFRTINVVRRPETAEELRRLGYAVICTATESIENRVQVFTNGAGVPFAIDAVGGATAAAVARALAPGGRLLLYGVLSGEPIPLEPRTLMVSARSIQGFWLSEWVRRQKLLTMFLLARRIARLMQQGVLVSEVAASFPLEQIQAAVRQADAPGRHGKILLRMATS